MLSETVIQFEDVWKKYNAHDVFHRSLREDIVNLFRSRNAGTISENEFWALRGISASIKRGECIGLYGHNGAGKSTVLKLIANVTYSTKGDVTVKGKVAPMIEIGAGFHPDLTGRENVYINGTIIGMKINEIKQKFDDILAFSELETFIDMPVKKYSSGMYLKLGFSIATHSSAEIVLIDEVMSVGDDDFQKKCIKRIKKLKDEGRTIIVVSHNRALLTEVTDRVLVMHKGMLE